MTTYVYVCLPKLCIMVSVYYWEMLTRNQSKDKFQGCIPICRINNCFVYIKAELRVLINGMSNKL